MEEPSSAQAAGNAGELPPADMQQQGSLRPALSSPRASGEARQRKQVRFEGVSAPWVPPARRPGYQPRWGPEAPHGSARSLPEKGAKREVLSASKSCPGTFFCMLCIDHRLSKPRACCPLGFCRCTELPPDEGAEEGQPAQQERAARQGRPGSLSSVPDHVKNPHKVCGWACTDPGSGAAETSCRGAKEPGLVSFTSLFCPNAPSCLLSQLTVLLKLLLAAALQYTCYVLDEPLVVGGGVAQLSRSSQQADVPPAVTASGSEAPAEEGQVAEPERWAGAVGKGAVQFRPRQRPEGDAAEPPAGASKAGGTAAAARQKAPKLAFDDSADVEADDGAVGAGSAAMQIDASDAVPQPQPRSSKRQYRSSRAAAPDDE